MAINVGLVGLGFLGTAHARILQSAEGAKLAAVCDIRPSRMEGSPAPGNIDTGAGGVDLKNVRKYADFRDMLADGGLDMIDVCTPTYLHAAMAIQAMEAGNHCFCEKPMALTSRDARGMVRASKKAGRFLMVGHCLRFWPEYLLLKDMISSGRYGPVRSATFRRVGGRPAWSWENWFLDTRRSGHCALDMHIHDVDAVQWFFGPPSGVRAYGARTADGGVDHIIAHYRYPGMGPIVAEGGWFDEGFPFSMSAVVVFQKATVEYGNQHSPTMTVYTGAGKQTPPIPAASAYEDELKYFLKCLADGTPPDRVDPETSARAVAIVEAELESARSGKPVSLEAKETAKGARRRK